MPTLAPDPQRRRRLTRLLGMDRIAGRLRLVTVLLVALPVLASLVFFAAFARQALLRQASAELHGVLDYRASLIDTWMRERLDDARFLAATRTAAEGDAEAMTLLFRNYVVHHPHVTSVVVIDAQGILRFDLDGPPGMSLGDRRYFQEAMQGRSSISEALVGRSSGRPIVIFAAPINGQDGRPRGVLFCPARLESIDKLLASTGRVNTWLVDATGLALTEPPFGPELKARGLVEDVARLSWRTASPLVQAAREGVEPSGPYTNDTGRRVLGAWRRVKDGNWLLLAELPESVIMEGYASYLGVSLLGALVTILLLTPFLRRMARSVEHPIADLAGHAQAMARGEFDPEAASAANRPGTRELAALHDAFLDMAKGQREALARLETLSTTDQLTGIANRRQLDTQGRAIIEVSRRGNQPCACIMLDVDNFKSINDSYGHAAGDRLLAHVAGIIAESCRGSDLCARFGGEEFTIIAPNADARQARLLAERIRQRVADTPVELEGISLCCTISAGVSEYSDSLTYGASLLDDMLSKADKALYRAKQDGRNRVELFRECCSLKEEQGDSGAKA